MNEYDNDPLLPGRRIMASKGKKIKSMGRVSVTAPQTTVVVQGDADWEAFSRFSRGRTKSIYPPGSQENFDLLRGELAFHYAEQPDNICAPNPNFSAPKVKTCFNGESLAANLVFAGVVDKEYIRAQRRDDTAVTLRKAGTHTIVNTGSDVITQGSKVYWCFPDIMRSASGAVQPTVDITGVPAGKFTATLRSLNHNDIYSILCRISGRALKIASKRLQREVSEAEAKQEAEQLINECSLLRDAEFVEADTDLMDPMGQDVGAFRRANPIRRLVGACLATVVSNNWYSTSGSDTDPEQMHFLREAHAAQSHTGSRIKGRGSAKRRKGAAYALESFEFEGDDEQAALGTGGRAAKLGTESLVRYIIEASLDVMRMLESRVIGTALSTAMPGKQFGTCEVRVIFNGGIALLLSGFKAFTQRNM